MASLSPQDRLDITELLARYNHAVDGLEAEEWAALFTEDGALMANGHERARGRAALTAYVAARRDAGTPLIRHVLTNVVIDPTEAGARVRAYVLAYRVDDWTGMPYLIGQYEDDVVRDDGEWRFKQRRMSVVAGKSATGR